MPVSDTSREGQQVVARAEHNSDGKSKRTTLRQIVPSTGDWVNISAVDNGDGTYALRSTTQNALVTEPYDYISFGYTGSDITSITFKKGGSTGTVVATLALAYSGANIASVTKS